MQEMAPMETMNQVDDFVISASADRLLSSVSDDFADFILKIASEIAAKDDDGTKVVTTDDIKKVVQAICAGIEVAAANTVAPGELRSHVEHLRKFCDSIVCERSAE